MENLEPRWEEPKLENLLDSSSLSFNNSQYVVYFQPEVTDSDIAFGYRASEDKDISLFQITLNAKNKNSSRSELAKIDFSKEETLKELLNVGEKLKKSYDPEVLSSIKTEWGDYLISYQAHDMKILDKSLHDQYYEKLKGRLH